MADKKEFLKKWCNNLPTPLFSSLVEIAPSSIHGQGLHAVVDIDPGEILVVDQGIPVHNSIVELVTEEIDHQNDLCIDWDTSLLDASINGGAYANHSCSPNMGLANERTFVSIAKVKAGEELVVDYATFAADDTWSFPCECKSPNCRKTVSGADHKNKEFRDAMGEYFTPYLKRYWEEKES